MVNVTSAAATRSIGQGLHVKSDLVACDVTREDALDDVRELLF